MIVSPRTSTATIRKMGRRGNLRKHYYDGTEPAFKPDALPGKDRIQSPREIWQQPMAVQKSSPGGDLHEAMK